MAKDTIEVAAGAESIRYDHDFHYVPPSTKYDTFWTSKRAADILCALGFMPLIALSAIGLLLVKPFFNRGPLFFVQERMGRDMKPFKVIKFRSMLPSDTLRRAQDPLENDRITRVGWFIRRTRIDELPQFLNVLKGEMSLIGPRPDMMSHSLEFIQHIPEYRKRFSVRPGITGLAQTTVGYVEGVDATRFKAEADIAYINNASFTMEAKVLFLTVLAVLKFAGR